MHWDDPKLRLLAVAAKSFDHIALYLVLQAIALFTVFVASRETRKSREFVS
jgi:hypothetical protein